MKLTLMLTLALTWQVNALAFSQKVTISVREEPLENVIQEIRRQTGYAFFFDAAYLRQAHPVTLELTAVLVEDALEQLFKKQQFNFSIDNRIITIKPRPDGAIRRVQTRVQGIVTDKMGRASGRDGGCQCGAREGSTV